MKKYLIMLLAVMGIMCGGLSIGWLLGNLLKFLIFDKGVEMWIVFLAFIFILSIVVTTIDYFITKNDKENEE